MWPQEFWIRDCESVIHLGKALFHLGQDVLSSHLLHKGIEIKIYRTIILPEVSVIMGYDANVVG